MPRMLPKPRSLWEATAPPAADAAPLHGSVRARAVVIGGGYTGLSAALHLAEAGQDAVVLEAAAPGWGASGRNGGQVIAGVKYDPDKLCAIFGAEAGERVAACVGAAPDMLFDLIAKHDIPCDAVRTGWIQLAVSAATLATLRARVSQWRARGADVTLVNADEAARLTGSAAYQGGLLDRRGGTVQPLALARGMAATATTAGARIFAGSPAAALQREGQSWRVSTPGGDVLADSVILATNAYAGKLHDPLRRSIVTVPSWQIATDPLPADVRASILPGGQSGSDMRRLLCYFRLDAAGRFVLGSRGDFADPQPDRAIRRLVTTAARLFPQLRGVAFTYQWGGMVAMTPDHLPHLHTLAPNLFAALGYNGRGVALATTLGQQLAALACGGETALPVTRLHPIPLHATARLAARATIAWYRLRDRRTA
jgi:glycine/D-amino acid oxidase-like deaminating enzyme